MYGIEEIFIYTNNFGNQKHIYINILNQKIFINQIEHRYEEDDIKSLLQIIKLWKSSNLNSSNLDDETIEITIKGNNFEENISSKSSNIKNYNQFVEWIMKYYE